jgi:hypothetical protein
MPAGARAGSRPSFALRSPSSNDRRSLPLSFRRSNAYSIASAAFVPPVERVEHGDSIRAGDHGLAVQRE